MLDEALSPEWLEQLQSKIGYTANNPDLLRQAVTHRSFLQKRPELQGDYERLEFIGDAVVDLIVADLLYAQFPQDDEGHLSRKRASLVCEEALYNIAMRMQLDEVLLLDGPEERQGLRSNKRLLASMLEGLIGAIYKDGGFTAVCQWVEQLYKNNTNLEFQEHDFAKDYKTRFQELIQDKFKTTPIYQMCDMSGPDHQKMFKVQVLVHGEVYGEGTGESKKVAAQMAAEVAMKRYSDGV